MNVKHAKLEIQRYLKANKMKINQDEAITIFKMRSRISNVKVNFRGKYESYQCDVCEEEDENQEHLMKYKEITKNKNNCEKNKNDDKLFESSVENMKEIATCFMENMKIREKLVKMKPVLLLIHTLYAIMHSVTPSLWQTESPLGRCSSYFICTAYK